MTVHVMLDLETWGTIPGCDIRSIGACLFDPLTGQVCIPVRNLADTGYDETDGIFYVATENPFERFRKTDESGFEFIGFEDVYEYPLKRDPATVQWWSEQSAEAQAAFANPIDLREALAQFAAWYVGFDNGNYGSRDIRIWANDPHFDVSILAAAFRAVGLDEPWHYRSPRSMKTAVELAGMTSDDYSNYGDAHNALHDAIAQAMTVCEAYKRLGLRK